jgi:tRNA dimethylallyltransferase
MVSNNAPVAVFLMGPTAAGKSRLAMELHSRFPVELVSVDSSQVYRGMDIGTAKPSAAERARTPHRLIDIRDPAEPYSAADFRVDALREMNAITRQGRVPLLVGGSMLYFHTLEHGLTELPPADAVVRARLCQESVALGWPVLHRRLQAIDPCASARIHPHDGQRIQRALEIAEVSGRPPSYWYRSAQRSPLAFNVIRIGICPHDRSALHERIRRRLGRMLDQGFVAEVEQLRNRGDLGPELPSMRTVGYRQVWQYLTGLVNYNQMLERSVNATRQLAKRQLTWLRNYADVHYLDGSDRDLESACSRYLASRLAREGL